VHRWNNSIDRIGRVQFDENGALGFRVGGFYFWECGGVSGPVADEDGGECDEGDGEDGD